MRVVGSNELVPSTSLGLTIVKPAVLLQRWRCEGAILFLARCIAR